MIAPPQSVKNRIIASIMIRPKKQQHLSTMAMLLAMLVSVYCTSNGDNAVEPLAKRILTTESRYDLLIDPSSTNNEGHIATGVDAGNRESSDNHINASSSFSISASSSSSNNNNNITDAIQDRWDPPIPTTGNGESNSDASGMGLPASSLARSLVFSRYSSLFDSFYDQPSSSSSSSSPSMLSIGQQNIEPIVHQHNQTRRFWTEKDDEEDVQKDVSPQSASPLPTPPTNNHFSLSLSPNSKTGSTNRPLSLTSATTNNGAAQSQGSSFAKEPVFDDGQGSDDMDLDDYDEVLRHQSNNHQTINSDNSELKEHNEESESARMNMFNIENVHANRTYPETVEDTMSSPSSQNFIVADQIMPYMNAYSTNADGSGAAMMAVTQRIPTTMMMAKPVNNEDVFIVHHQHHYPPVFLNPELMPTPPTTIIATGPRPSLSPLSSTALSGPTTTQVLKAPKLFGTDKRDTQSASGQSIGKTVAKSTTANNSSSSSLKAMKNSKTPMKIKKKSKKLQIVYIKVPLLNLMDGKTSTTTTSTNNGGKLSSMEVDEIEDSSIEDLSHLADGSEHLSFKSATVPPITINNLAAGITMPPQAMERFTAKDILDSHNKYNKNSLSHQITSITTPNNEQAMTLISGQSNAYSSNGTTSNPGKNSDTTVSGSMINNDTDLIRNQRETRTGGNNNNNNNSNSNNNNNDQNNNEQSNNLSNKSQNNAGTTALQDLNEFYYFLMERLRPNETNHNKDMNRNINGYGYGYGFGNGDRNRNHINHHNNNMDSFDNDSRDVDDKEANASTNSFLTSPLEPLFYNYPSGNNNQNINAGYNGGGGMNGVDGGGVGTGGGGNDGNSGNGQWPQEKSLGILPILIQIEEKKDKNNPNKNGALENALDFSRNNLPDKSTFMNIPTQMQPGDWSPASNLIGAGVGMGNIGGGWQMTGNKHHPIRNVIFHNNKPSGLNMNGAYPTHDHHGHYHAHHRINNNNKFAALHPYMDEEQMMNSLLSQYPTSNRMHKNNPMFSGVSDSHLNYFGPIVPNGLTAAASNAARQQLPIPNANLAQMVANNPNLNYRLLEYWLLKNQMLNPGMDIQKMNRMKMNQDLLAVMQSKISPKVSLDLEQAYFPYGPGMFYGNYLKMPQDKYREAFIRSKLMQAANAAALSNHHQQQQMMAAASTAGGTIASLEQPPTMSVLKESNANTNSKDINNNNPSSALGAIFWNNNTKDKKRQRSFKNALALGAKPFSSLASLSDKSAEQTDDKKKKSLPNLSKLFG